MGMPAAIRAALRLPDAHSEASYLFAQFARAQTKDDFVLWEAPTGELERAMADVNLEGHALERVHERIAVERLVEASRSLRSGDAGAFRATARTSRIVLYVRESSAPVQLFFSEATGRFIRMDEDGATAAAAFEELPAGCARKLEDGIRAASADVLPPARAREALSALAVGGPPLAWRREVVLRAVTTTAVLVFKEHRTRRGQLRLHLKTLYLHGEMYSVWRSGPSGRYWRRRFQHRDVARQARAARSLEDVADDDEEEEEEEEEEEADADGSGRLAFATFGDYYS
jgi:hypothetical protein